MAYLAPFILGILTGSLIQWQWGRRQKKVLKHAHTGVAEVVAGDERNASAVVITPAKPLREEPVAAENGERSDAAEAPALDDLTAVRGIGPVYARRLNAAGILTFAQLADLTPEQLTEIVVQGNIDKVIEPQDWIAQAQNFIARQAP